MTALGWLLLGLACGLGGGYPWGRWLGRRALDRAWDEGYDEGRTDGYDDALADAEDECGQTVMLDGSIPLRAGEPSAGLSGPVPPRALADWQGRMATELAPEALAQDVPPGVSEYEAEAGAATGPQRSTDRSLRVGTPLPPEGHPSPYHGNLTPAQRRRDKHKHRGIYAAAPGWTPDHADVLSPHWKPEGDRWVAEWRIEWQDDVAAVDEEIAAWGERARWWLAADPWDRSMRRLEVA